MSMGLRGRRDELGKTEEKEKHMAGVVLWAVDGWDTLPSGPFEMAKGGK